MSEDPGWVRHVRTVLPHGGSLPEAEWRRRNAVIVALLWAMIAVVAIYGWFAHGRAEIRYAPEIGALLACTGLSVWAEWAENGVRSLPRWGC